MKIEKGGRKALKRPLQVAAAAWEKKAVVVPKLTLKQLHVICNQTTKVAPIAKAKAPVKGA